MPDHWTVIVIVADPAADVMLTAPDFVPRPASSRSTRICMLPASVTVPAAGDSRIQACCGEARQVSCPVPVFDIDTDFVVSPFAKVSDEVDTARRGGGGVGTGVGVGVGRGRCTDACDVEPAVSPLSSMLEIDR
jgi:hypothetical protein